MTSSNDSGTAEELDITKQSDFSQDNVSALSLLRECLDKGYILRIDDIEITEYPAEKVIALKPNLALERLKAKRDTYRETAGFKSKIKGDTNAEWREFFGKLNAQVIQLDKQIKELERE